MTHSDMDEFYELYALGVLESEAAAQIDEHVADGCAYCLEHLQDAALLTSSMAALAEPRKPDRNVRKRLLDSVGRPQRSHNLWFAVAALSAACFALAVYSFWAAGAVRSLRNQIGAVEDERNELRSAVEILSQPGTRTVQFGVAENVPHGRAFVTPRGGIVFVGSQLPGIAADRAFELWLIPKQGAPRPAGVFRPNERGNFVNVAQRSVNVSDLQALAVSVEPLQGSPAPTTTPILIVPLA
ncbi:MAG TPA: anti-sigma factor [Bryobacteraceae bacterium]